MNQHEQRILREIAESIGAEYAAGYRKGLLRHVHGVAPGSEQEHEANMLAGLGDDAVDFCRLQRGNGYRDGFAGRKPQRRRGRPSISENGDVTTVKLYLTAEQREKLRRLGGSAWVRDRIDRAKVAG